MADSKVRIHKTLSVWHFLILSPFLIAIIYSTFNRTLDDYVSNSILIVVIIESAVLLNIAYGWITLGQLKPPVSIGAVVASFMAAVIIAPIYYSAAVAVRDLYIFLLSPESGRTPTVFITVIMTLGLGIGLFIFRLKARAYYGLTEIMVGVTVAVYRVTTTPGSNLISSTDLYLAVLTAGIYLVVRGLDNVHQGLDKEPDSFLARLIRGRNLQRPVVEVTVESETK